MGSMNKYIIYWRSGESQLVEGRDIADAFTRAGYGAGALRAVDFYDATTNGKPTYQWDKASRKWVKV